MSTQCSIRSTSAVGVILRTDQASNRTQLSCAQTKITGAERLAPNKMSCGPYISIIIPAYNAQEWIADALESCVSQQYHPFQIIIVDDGSTDNTYAIASRYMDANVDLRVLRTANKGASAARNTGLSSAKGEYVIFLDADDVLADNALRNCGSIAGRTKADAVLGAIQVLTTFRVSILNRS